MKVANKFGKGLALVACVAMLGSTTFAGHIDKFVTPIAFRDISSGGNLSIPHFGLADWRVNTKSGHICLKAKRGNIRNSSGSRFVGRKIPGPAFGLPGFLGVRVKYVVSAHDDDNSHDEDAKIRGRN